MMPDTKELFFKIKPIIDENIGKIYAIEQALYSDKLKVAGRVDCIAEWNGKLSIIDFKTSSKLKDENYIQNYFMQCSAYAEMFGERTGIDIEQIVVLIAVEDDAPQTFVKTKYNYLESLSKLIQSYK